MINTSKKKTKSKKDPKRLENKFKAEWKKYCPEIPIISELNFQNFIQENPNSLYLIPEYHFTNLRAFRLDFACPKVKVGIEIHGGIYSRGRHTRGSGFERDCEKFFMACQENWLVFPLVESMINLYYLNAIFDKIKERKLLKF